MFNYKLNDAYSLIYKVFNYLYIKLKTEFNLLISKNCSMKIIYFYTVQVSINMDKFEL